MGCICGSESNTHPSETPRPGNLHMPSQHNNRVAADLYRRSDDDDAGGGALPENTSFAGLSGEQHNDVPSGPASNLISPADAALPPDRHRNENSSSSGSRSPRAPGGGSGGGSSGEGRFSGSSESREAGGGGVDNSTNSFSDSADDSASFKTRSSGSKSSGSRGSSPRENSTVLRSPVDPAARYLHLLIGSGKQAAAPHLQLDDAATTTSSGSNSDEFKKDDDDGEVPKVKKDRKMASVDCSLANAPLQPVVPANGSASSQHPRTGGLFSESGSKGSTGSSSSSSYDDSRSKKASCDSLAENGFSGTNDSFASDIDLLPISFRNGSRGSSSSSDSSPALLDAVFVPIAGPTSKSDEAAASAATPNSPTAKRSATKEDVLLVGGVLHSNENSDAGHNVFFVNAGGGGDNSSGKKANSSAAGSLADGNKNNNNSGSRSFPIERRNTEVFGKDGEIPQMARAGAAAGDSLMQDSGGTLRSQMSSGGSLNSDSGAIPIISIPSSREGSSDDVVVPHLLHATGNTFFVNVASTENKMATAGQLGANGGSGSTGSSSASPKSFASPNLQSPTFPGSATSSGLDAMSPRSPFVVGGGGSDSSLSQRYLVGRIVRSESSLLTPRGPDVEPTPTRKTRPNDDNDDDDGGDGRTAASQQFRPPSLLSLYSQSGSGRFGIPVVAQQQLPSEKEGGGGGGGDSAASISLTAPPPLCGNEALEIIGTVDTTGAFHRGLEDLVTPTPSAPAVQPGSSAAATTNAPAPPPLDIESLRVDLSLGGNGVMWLGAPSSSSTAAAAAGTATEKKKEDTRGQSIREMVLCPDEGVLTSGYDTPLSVDQPSPQQGSTTPGGTNYTMLILNNGNLTTANIQRFLQEQVMRIEEAKREKKMMQEKENAAAAAAAASSAVAVGDGRQRGTSRQQQQEQTATGMMPHHRVEKQQREAERARRRTLQMTEDESTNSHGIPALVSLENSEEFKSDDDTDDGDSSANMAETVRPTKKKCAPEPGQRMFIVFTPPPPSEGGQQQQQDLNVDQSVPPAKLRPRPSPPPPDTADADDSTFSLPTHELEPDDGVNSASSFSLPVVSAGPSFKESPKSELGHTPRRASGAAAGAAAKMEMGDFLSEPNTPMFVAHVPSVIPKSGSSSNFGAFLAGDLVESSDHVVQHHGNSNRHAGENLRGGVMATPSLTTQQFAQVKVPTEELILTHKEQQQQQQQLQRRNDASGLSSRVQSGQDLSAMTSNSQSSSNSGGAASGQLMGLMSGRTTPEDAPELPHAIQN